MNSSLNCLPLSPAFGSRTCPEKDRFRQKGATEAGRQKNTEKGQGHPKGQDLQEGQDRIHQSLE